MDKKRTNRFVSEDEVMQIWSINQRSNDGDGCFLFQNSKKSTQIWVMQLPAIINTAGTAICHTGHLLEDVNLLHTCLYVSLTQANDLSSHK